MLWGERLEQFTERGNWDRLLYVHEDVMGNTMHYTKATGQSFGELRYDVWGAPTLSGKLLNNDNGNFVAATFTGHIYDTVLDIYFAEARFYDAKHRQWMSTDPIKDGLNWYEYCGSNPTTYFDPTGLVIFENEDGDSSKDDGTNSTFISAPHSNYPDSKGMLKVWNGSEIVVYSIFVPKIENGANSNYILEGSR